MSKTYIMTWGCPNCFKSVSGISDEDGYVRLICRNCGSKMVMKKMARRKHVLEIIAPQGQYSMHG